MGPSSQALAIDGVSLHHSKLIHAFLIINQQGMPRLVRFYDSVSGTLQASIIREILFHISLRSKDTSGFIFHNTGLPDCHAVYKKLNRLYFVMLVDEAENDLACLDLIQCFYDSLNVEFDMFCEQDLVFNVMKLNWLLDELLCGGVAINNQKFNVVQQFRAHDPRRLTIV